MANRVLMDAGGFKVSKPGANVLTTGDFDREMAFSSNWATSSKIIISGSVNIGSGTTTINYGRTLDHIPTVIAMGREGSGNTWVNVPYMNYGQVFPEYTTFGAGQSNSYQQALNYFRYQTGRPSYLSIFNDRFTYTNTTGNPITRISYAVVARQ